MLALNVDGIAYQRQNVAATADGDNTVIAAPGAGKQILVTSFFLRAIGTGNVIVKSGAAGTVHDSFAAAAAPGTRFSGSGSVYFGQYVLDANAALVINNDAGVDTLGYITYRVLNNNV